MSKTCTLGAYGPQTRPMARLAEYLRALAEPRVTPARFIRRPPPGALSR